MKRDMKLIREILTKIEASESGYIAINRDEYSPPHLYHILIMVEGGLLVGTPLTSQAGPLPYGWGNLRMTPMGHEFIDAARDEGIWKQAMQIIEDKGAGTVAIGILIQLLSSLAKQKFRLE